MKLFAMDVKQATEAKAAQDAAERILRESGFFRSIALTAAFCPVTFHGQLTSGHYVSFYARGHWISIEIFNDEALTQPVLAIAQRCDNPSGEVAAEVGAGAMDLSEAAQVLKTRLARVMYRLLQMRDDKALKLPLYQVTVKHGEKRSNRLEVARACLALGVEVVTFDGPDNSVLITCAPIHVFHICTTVITGVVSTVPYEPKK